MESNLIPYLAFLPSLPPSFPPCLPRHSCHDGEKESSSDHGIFDLLLLPACGVFTFS